MSSRDKAGIIRERSCSRHSTSARSYTRLGVKERETELETDAKLLPDAAHRNRQTWNFCVSSRMDRRDAGTLGWMVRKRRRIYTRHCISIYERLGAFLAVREAAR